ncbi:hypothetical protein [Sphingomonas sp.]|jgi:hypothetical protein|uniref:hypothetical protein n=1 Tax=Sphingomonas sp. TaxID=28214 RepID=UPI003B3A2D41
MMPNLAHAVIVAAMIAAPAAAVQRTPDEQLAKLLEGRVAGQPVNCISLGRLNSSSVTIPRTALAYRQGGTWYVNRFHDDCQQLNDDTIVVTRTPTSRLCRGDIADLVRRPANIPAGSCIFDDFIPYRKAG